MTRPAVGTAAHKIRIGNRDNWICSICGQPVDRGLSVYESRLAAVVDHIIPRCKGGTHEDGNLQIAHFECNRIKGRQVPALDERRQAELIAVAVIALGRSRHWDADA